MNFKVTTVELAQPMHPRVISIVLVAHAGSGLREQQLMKCILVEAFELGVQNVH
jgi:hypothetical protein